MTKYYAAAGQRSIVVTAENAVDAADKFIDHVLGDHVWIYGDESICQSDRRAHLAMETWLTLDSQVVISQRGAGRDDAGTFDTAELVETWHQLMTGVARMFA